MVDLARAAGISVSSVKRLEDGASTSPGARSQVLGAFEGVGVVFATDGILGEGVWFNGGEASNGRSWRLGASAVSGDAETL